MDGDRLDRPRLVEISRGVDDPSAVSEFFAWLLEVEPAADAGTYRFEVANGALLVHPDASRAVAIRIAGSRELQGEDPDGMKVHVDAAASVNDSNAGDITLDHVALMCADVGETARFYRHLGFEVTWSARGEEYVEGLQEEPISGAHWMHVSGADGYLSLAQSDGQNDYGVHTTAAGPPRFVHLGLAVENLAKIISRLDDASIEYLAAPTSGIGERIYLNDPTGDPRRGWNIEVVEYVPGVARSGRLP